MGNKKTNGRLNLAKKASAIFGTALTALTVSSVEAAQLTPTINTNGATSEIAQRTIKPIPVLMLNFANPEQSVLVAQHGSHSSHSSHSSHASSAFVS